MEWNKGYSASYYMTEVDPNTWKDLGRIDIKGGTITRNQSGLRQSASIDTNNYSSDRERYVRIYLDTMQSGTGAHEALFTGLATSPDRQIKGTWSENNIACYSVLKPAEDILLTRGYYASAGVSVANIINELLSEIPAPIDFADGAPSLTYPIVAESGETILTMVDRILEAIGWNVRILGSGHIRFEPYSSEPMAVFDPLMFDVIETQIAVTYDWFSCPNCYMVNNNGVTAIAKDTDPNSPLSIQNRGREVWKQESNASLNANETLSDYTRRRLKEEQQYKISASYDRRFVPDVFPGDVVELRYPSQGLNDEFVVAEQSITLGYSARTSEKIIGVG